MLVYAWRLLFWVESHAVNWVYRENKDILIDTLAAHHDKSKFPRVVGDEGSVPVPVPGLAR